MKRARRAREGENTMIHMIQNAKDQAARLTLAAYAAAAAAGYRLADIARLDRRYPSMDGLHPNGEGMKQLARFWLETTEEL